MAAIGVWCLLAASAGYWALHYDEYGVVQGEMVAALNASAPRAGRLAHLLGAPEAATEEIATPADHQFMLYGILARSGQGAALIGVDGGLARPVRVGQALLADAGDESWVLESVSAHGAVLRKATERQELELPPLDQRSRETDAVPSDAQDPAIVHAPQIRNSVQARQAAATSTN